MATTPVSTTFLTPTSASVDVSNTLIADSRENLSSTITVDGVSGIFPTGFDVISSSIDVSTTLISDLKESLLSNSTVDPSAPVQAPIATSDVGGVVEVSISSFSSTPTASEQVTKVQIWSIS